MRKPIELQHAGMLTPRARVWATIRKFGKPDGQQRTWSLMELQDATKPLVDFGTLEVYAYLLRRASYIEVALPKRLVGGHGNTSARYRLLKDSFDAPRLNHQAQPSTYGLAQLAMWRAMKALKEFTYRDIQRAATLGQVVVHPESARIYCKLLERSGYFRVLAPGQRGTPPVYRLVRDTGAHPPVVCKRKAVFDANLGQFTWQQSEQEVCDGLE